MQDDNFLTAAEVARRLGLSRESVIRRVHRRELEGVVRSGRYYIPPAAVRAFIRRQAREERSWA